MLTEQTRRTPHEALALLVEPEGADVSAMDYATLELLARPDGLDLTGLDTPAGRPAFDLLAQAITNLQDHFTDAGVPEALVKRLTLKALGIDPAWWAATREAVRVQ